jgi:lipoprotein signal peptidase
MDRKKIIWFFMIIGGAVGNYLPLIWGGSSFSFASIILGMIGGIVGIFIGFKLGQ